jgi:hypothetical protein
MTAQTITASASGTWTIGDLVVNRVGFGAMRLTQTGAAFAKDAASSGRTEATNVLRRAVELGVNHIDTAAFYFSPLRSANELINHALAPYPDDLVIVTKVGPGRDPSGTWLPQATPQQLRGQVEEKGSSATWACRTSTPTISSRPRPSRRWSASRTGTASARDRSRTSSYASAVTKASPSSRSTRSPAADATPARTTTTTATRCTPSRAPTASAPRRSDWRGPCTAARTSWSSPALEIPPTSSRTWLPVRCASPTTN